jgi:hypothetical protein
MRTFSSLALAAALRVPLFGQVWDRGPYDDRGYGRDRYSDRDSRNGRNGNSGYNALDRVEQDLRSVAARGGYGAYGNSNSRRSVEKALNDLGRVRNDWQRKGRVDTGRVDSAVRHISEAMRDNRLDGRDRATLSRAIGVLQSLRNGGGYYSDRRW